MLAVQTDALPGNWKLFKLWLGNIMYFSYYTHTYIHTILLRQKKILPKCYVIKYFTPNIPYKSERKGRERRKGGRERKRDRYAIFKNKFISAMY